MLPVLRPGCERTENVKEGRPRGCSEVSSRLFQLMTGGSFKRVLQEGCSGGWSMRVAKEGWPRLSSKKVVEEGCQGRSSWRVVQEGW